MTVLELDGLSVRFGKRDILRDLRVHLGFRGSLSRYLETGKNTIRVLQWPAKPARAMV